MLSQQTKPQEEKRLNTTELKQQETIDKIDKVGFTRYTEILHGRMAMIGFIILLAIAVLSKHGVINLVSNL
ncbi:MAG: chlorophyll a/b-binding protein [Xenococcaceae cyanobacterium MO_188.B32]|nr:chlorophyll a/b-binding protein [Xenococcaceae cyanobacterium MO_188.B32]